MIPAPPAQHVPCPSCGGVRLHPDERRGIVRDLIVAIEQVLAEQSPETQLAPVTFDATPKDIAARYGVSAAWVRMNAEALGGVRLGSGPKPRHRFNVAITDEHMAKMRSQVDAEASKTATPRTQKRRRTRQVSAVPLLPIKAPPYT